MGAIVADNDASTPNDRLGDELEQIAEISRSAGGAWLSLLIVALFCVVTLMGHSDADFFEAGAGTELPFFGTTVPAQSFFIGAPLLVLGVFVYLHIYLVKLWRALSVPPMMLDASDDRPRRLDEAVFPWLLNDAALRWRAGAPSRPFGWLTGLGTWVLCWALTPLLIGAFWIRSMPLHDEFLTLFLGALLCIGLCVAWTSRRLARRILAGRDPRSTGVVGWFFALLLFAIAGVVSWTTTEGGLYAPTQAEQDENGTAIANHRVVCDYATFYDGWNCFLADFALHGDGALLVPANLEGAQLAKPPAGYRPHLLAFADFYDAYVARQREEFGSDWRDELFAAAGGDDPSWEATILREFAARRAADRALIERRSLAGFDLRRANLDGAFLDGVDLRLADLRLSSMVNVQLEGARLNGAKLADASLFRAQLQHASLYFADLSRAHLLGAQLDGAQAPRTRLKGSRLNSVSARGANFDEADFSEATLSNANFEDATFRRAVFSEASVTASNFDRAIMARASFGRANLSTSTFRAAILASANLEGALLVSATLSNADLSWARLSGANLSEATLRDATLYKAGLANATFEDADLAGATLVGADLTSAALAPVALEGTFGDAATTIDSGLARPQGWATQELDPSDHEALWRAWRRSADDPRDE